MLGISFSVELLMREELVLDSEMSIIGSLIAPVTILIVGTEGYLQNLNDIRKPQLIKLWSILSAYFVLMSIAVYFQWLPAKHSLFVMPLITAVAMLPWVLWQRWRIRGVIDNRLTLAVQYDWCAVFRLLKLRHYKQPCGSFVVPLLETVRLYPFKFRVIS